MSMISLEDYVGTGRARFSFVPGRAGYVAHGLISPTVLSWVPRFKLSGAQEFIIGDELLTMAEHQVIDLLIACRSVLLPGGSILFEFSAAASYEGLDQRLLRTLASLGFATHLLLSGTGDGGVQDYRPARDAMGEGAGTIIRAIKVSEGHVGNNGSPETVYVVGDSHVWFLSGASPREAQKDKGFGGLKFGNAVAFFKGFHLGPGLAYNLGKLGSTVGCTEKLEILLGNPAYIPAGSRIMIVLGEIDCRIYVCPLAERLGKPIAEIVEGITAVYRDYLIKLIGRGFRPMVWGPVAPTPREPNNAPNRVYPIGGSFEQRKEATRVFNQRMDAICGELGLPFLSVMESLLGQDGVTDLSLYADPVHVGQVARPLLWDIFQKKTGLRTMWSAET